MPLTESPNEGVHFQLKWPKDHPIDIPPFPLGLTPANAVTAIGTILDFLRLFVSLSGLTSSHVQTILMSYVVCPDGNRPVDIGNFSKLLRLSESMKLDLSFIMPVHDVNDAKKEG
jgi:hypothetical protein